MHLRFLAAPLLMGAVILFVPASTGAVPIHVHKKVPVKKEVIEHELVRGDPVGPIEDTVIIKKTVVDVVHVPPVDKDDDGIADHEDDCIGYCAPPEPVYAEASTGSSYSGGYSGSGLTDSPVGGYYGTGDAIPSYITDCESGGDYGAYNPSSGATGAYQIIPSTAAAYGCDLSYPAGQDACAAEIYASEGASAWDCG